VAWWRVHVWSCMPAVCLLFQANFKLATAKEAQSVRLTRLQCSAHSALHAQHPSLHPLVATLCTLVPTHT
jgi:hypothetical protein